MTDNWTARDNQRLVSENKMLREELKRKTIQILEMELRELSRENRERIDEAWLQGKVLRQKRRIKALEQARELSVSESIDRSEES